MEICVTIENIRFYNENNGYSVLDCLYESRDVVVVGNFPRLYEGEEIKISGKWIEHQIYGEQFLCDGYKYSVPNSLKAIENYLSGGLFKGIGPSLAKEIIEKFANDTLRIIEHEPERLLEVPGIGDKKLSQIVESYAEHGIRRRWIIFLQSCGFSLSMSLKIINEYGPSTEAIIRTNPYRLIDDIPGIGFRKADSIAIKNGFAFDGEERCAYALRFILQEAANTNGDLFLEIESLLAKTQELISVKSDYLKLVLEKLLLDKRLIAQNYEEKIIVQLPYYYRAEKDIANLLTQKLSIERKSISRKQLLNRVKSFEEKNDISFSEQQKKAIQMALDEGVLVITGGPGTGKTTILNCILSMLENKETVFLAAPTGRAAKRMSEATQKEAKTIHRLLSFTPESNDFFFNQNEPLKCDCLIVDEASMLDVNLSLAILKALRSDARLILVGDADQLPSVGAGNILSDIIESSKIPLAKLDTLFRQSEQSNININAQRINNGLMPVICKKQGDFFLESFDNAQLALDSITSLYSHRIPNYLKTLDIDNDIQILASNKMGICGVININKAIQNHVNPHEEDKKELKYGEYIFREGDKVINIKNDYNLKWISSNNEEGSGVFNGDLGYIHKINGTGLDVIMDDGRYVSYNQGQIENIELAYALTVHKSQGSEFNVVIMPVLGGNKLLNTRNLLYTAVTRAKKMVVLVGSEFYIQKMIDNTEKSKRNSCLCKLLSESFVL